MSESVRVFERARARSIGEGTAVNKFVNWRGR